jgi:hypothetical protein
MQTVERMIVSHPLGSVFASDALVACVSACTSCAQTCCMCADACLAEPAIDALRRCIRVNLDCADICVATSRVLSRLSNGESTFAATLLPACLDACRRCMAECQRHAVEHTHCRVCAEECQRCADACELLLRSVEPLDDETS